MTLLLDIQDQVGNAQLFFILVVTHRRLRIEFPLPGGRVTFFSGEQHAGGRELSATRIGKIGHGQIERGDTQASTLFIGQQEGSVAKMHIFQRDLHPR